MQIEWFSKILIENIDKLKIEASKNMQMIRKKLWDDTKWEIVNNINNRIIESEYSKIDTYVYEGFPWNSKILAKSFIKDLNSDKSNSKKKLFIESNIYKSCVEKDSSIFIAEAVFGSHWSKIENIKESNNINQTEINKIDHRRQSAIKSVNSQIFCKKREAKYCEKLLNAQTEDMLKNSINHNNDWVVGWQKVSKFNEEDLKDKPLCALKQLTSTRGRLIVWQNWERLIRHPNFIYQNLLIDSYGISISKNNANWSK